MGAQRWMRIVRWGGVGREDIVVFVEEGIGRLEMDVCVGDGDGK